MPVKRSEDTVSHVRVLSDMKLLLALLMSLASLAAVSEARDVGLGKACEVFDWNGRPGYLKYSTGGISGPRRVSAASTCSLEGSSSGDDGTDPSYCPLTARGRFYTYFDTNVSTVTLLTSALHKHYYELVYSAIQPSLNGTTWDFARRGWVTTTQSLPPGTSGYINFTQLNRCFVGTLRNCTDELIQIGTVLEACCPVYRSYPENEVSPSLASLEGIFTVVNISQNVVDQFQDVPVQPFAGDGVARVHSQAIVLVSILLASAFLLLL